MKHSIGYLLIFTISLLFLSLVVNAACNDSISGMCIYGGTYLQESWGYCWDAEACDISSSDPDSKYRLYCDEWFCDGRELRNNAYTTLTCYWNSKCHVN